MLNGSTGGFCVLVLSLGALICSGLPAQAPPPVPPGGGGVREAPRENGPAAGKDVFPPPPGPGSESGPEGAPPGPGPDGGFEKPPHFFQKPAIVFHVVTKVYEAEAPLSGAASSETSSGAAPAGATPSSTAPAGAATSSVAASSTAPSNGAPSSGAPSTQAPSGVAEPAENKAGEGLASAEKTAPEGENNEVWQKTIDKVVMPGQPVNIKLAGKNIAVVVQFTPYLKKRLLVAQQQSWFQEDDGNLRYETTIQTIPLKFNKDIYYFPLGEEKKGTEYFMEIVLNLTPYSDNIKHDE